MHLLKVSFAVLFVAAMAVGSASAACTNATLTGAWGYFVGSSAGQFTADGKGNITAGSQTVSQSGTIATQTYTGTYSVATNCIVSVTLNFTGGGSTTAKLVLDQVNKGAQIIDTTSGDNASGLGAAQGTVTCGLTGTKKTFAALLFGKYPSTGTKVDYVLQVILDGKGNVSGSGTFDVGGTVTSSSISGTYTESSNCTGTAAITAGTSTLNFNFVVTTSGKQLFMLETDNGTSVGGWMQQ